MEVLFAVRLAATMWGNEIGQYWEMGRILK